MEIKTERLILRPLGVQDLDTVCAYSMSRENTRLMLYLPYESRQETLAFLERVEAEWAKERPAFYELAILFEGRQIGSVSLDDMGETAGELGWILHRDYWGRGIVLEAAAAAVDFAVRKLGRTHFFACCDSENTGSYRVMEKLGMKRTGVRFGRKNRGSDEPRVEYRYEMDVAADMKIMEAEERPEALIEELTKLWEHSVRATHHFLPEEEITRLRAYVPEALRGVQRLVVAETDQGRPAAFMGVEGQKLEMLFIAPEERKKGLGRELLSYGIRRYAVNDLAVNEQNPQARGFYEHMGFEVYRRTESDEQGAAYPLLYMRRPCAD